MRATAADGVYTPLLAVPLAARLTDGLEGLATFCRATLHVNKPVG